MTRQRNCPHLPLLTPVRGNAKQTPRQDKRNGHAIDSGVAQNKQPRPSLPWLSTCTVCPSTTFSITITINPQQRHGDQFITAHRSRVPHCEECHARACPTVPVAVVATTILATTTTGLATVSCKQARRAVAPCSALDHPSCRVPRLMSSPSHLSCNRTPTRRLPLTGKKQIPRALLLTTSPSSTMASSSRVRHRTSTHQPHMLCQPL